MTAGKTQTNQAANPLDALLQLPEAERQVRGLEHTPREIAQQPDTWVSTWDIFNRYRDDIAKFLAGFERDGHSDRTVFLIGAGTSDYIGRSLTQLLRRRWRCEVVAVPSTDLLTHADELMVPGQRHLWISFSRSADSPEGVALLERAWRDHPEILHIIVTCNRSGKMVQAAQDKAQALTVCLDDAANDRGLAMTSSFSNMLLFGQCLAHLDSPSAYEPILRKLVDGGRAFLPIAAASAANLANGPYRRACFIGSGALRGIARESALKLLEMTAGHVVTMSESVLGLRHGPMAALNAETLLVCYLSSDPRVRPYEEDLQREIGQKQLVPARVAVAEGAGSAELAEQWLVHPLGVDDEYRGPVDVMFGQLLGLFFSLRFDLKPDTPSPSGAITRVVHRINIHS